MSSEKAIQMIDALIKIHLQYSKSIRESTKDFHSDVSHMADTISDIHHDAAVALKAIKMVLTPDTLKKT